MPGLRIAALDRVPLGAAVLTALIAGLDVVASLPGEAVSRSARHALQRLPADALGAAHVARTPVAVALVLLAYHLWRRRRRAWQLSVGLLFVLGLFDLLEAVDVQEAVVCWLAVALLVFGRSSFYVLHDQRRRLHDWAGAASYVLAAFAVALSAALLANVVSEQGLGARQVISASASLLALIPVPSGFPEPGDWLAAFVNVVGFVALFGAARMLFRPRPPARTYASDGEQRRALALVRSHGRDTLAFFKLRGDQHYFFAADGRAFCGYRVAAGCLVVSGDPVGPRSSFATLWRELTAFAQERGLRLAVVNASGDFAAICTAEGMRSLYMGDEAMVASDFSLLGRRVRKVRQSVTRLRREGYSADLVRLGELSPEAVTYLESLAVGAREGRNINGFSSAMEGLRGEHQGDGLMLLCRDTGGIVRGFLHFVPCYGRPVVSLSAMCRAPGTPNGLTEYMVISALEHLRAGGVEEVSLNYAALSRYIHSPHRVHERVIGRVAKWLDPFFQIDSLYRFNAKFDPRWQPRFLVCEPRAGLPRAAIAILQAEGLIPRFDRRPRVGLPIASPAPVPVSPGL